MLHAASTSYDKDLAAHRERLYLRSKMGGYDESLEREIDDLLEEHEKDLMDEEEIDAILGLEGGETVVKRPDNRVEVSPSEFTEFAINIPVAGAISPFSFDERPYLPLIYDLQSPRVLMKCARQTEKSTGLGNISVAYSSLNVAFKVLFVTATAQQATVFSVDRIREVIEISPIIHNLTTTKLAQNVFFKQLRNRSQIRIRYAFLSADRVRGISADLILIDEIQDIATQNIPVIEQCASHSSWKLYRYSGTPKSMDNTIQIYWDQFSTQNEWAVPCEGLGLDEKGCGNWNILGERNIGKKGPICAKCGKYINPLGGKAQWVAKQPKTNNNRDRVTFEGFRIPQLMVPWIINNEEAWNDNVLFAYNRYERALFYNEVLGLSYDSGSRPLTRSQVQACCRDDIEMTEVRKNAARCDDGVYAGIDWGTAENESYTVITLGGYIGGVFTIFYAHRFTGPEVEPTAQLEAIAKLLVGVNFKLAGTDYGGGYYTNDWLMRTFGPEKIKKYQYVGKQLQKIKWQDKLGRFTMHKSEIMSDIFNAIKRGPEIIRFPNWEQWQEIHAVDMLNIFSEYSEQLRMTQYKISPGKSDDTFDAVVYCFLASMIIRQRPDILVSIKDGTVID